ncbi:hypothetical protein D5F01_LYC02274 [Larimichthys crocea]|uniref:Immunoglobulin subtype domain-containing protein n=1 Tax=Larimichthys crocea TaxID=215358 RepID=A0A6G0J8R2_LARCR|nr:hypothetical protein D5F01_LYC02274 [Larimichthys crocea]
MRVGILVMVMVCLSDGELHKCSVRLVVTVSKDSTTSISCPSITATNSEMKYLLLFNESYINHIHMSKQLYSADSVFSGQFKVTANHSGVYICKRELIYPPPQREDCHVTEVIVAEKQSSLTVNDTLPVTNQSCAVRPPLIPNVAMWAGCGVLLAYSLTVTSVAIVLWNSKMKREEDDTNIYINTRPGELRKPCKV